MVEKENDQGVVDPVKAKNLVRDMAILRAEELFTLKRFKSFGGTTPTKAVELLNNEPEKYRLHQRIRILNHYGKPLLP